MSKIIQVYGWKKVIFYILKKLQYSYPWDSIKGIQATGEASSLLEKTSNTSKKHFPFFSSSFSGILLLIWILIKQSKIKRGPNPQHWSIDDCGATCLLPELVILIVDRNYFLFFILQVPREPATLRVLPPPHHTLGQGRRQEDQVCAPFSCLLAYTPSSLFLFLLTHNLHSFLLS
jgi:hypothetical protein